MRFYVYKRALMLTAATVALLSGPANAATATTGCDSTNTTDYTDITKAVSVPLCTLYANKGAAGNITFESNGSLSIASSTNTTVPAIEINSNNSVIMDAGSLIAFNDTAAAVGIQADQGQTGEIAVGGNINLTGSGTGKTGILIGNPANTTVGTFTGISDTTNNPDAPTGDLTAVVLESGSVLNVTGGSSYGIRLSTGNSVTGDILVDGTVLMQPTNLTATSSSGLITAVEIDGNMTGNLLVGSGGVLTSYGAASQGLVVLGNITGFVQNLGFIDVTGRASPTTNGTNPVAGTAFAISGNVTGGIYNGGPVLSGDGVTAATIESTGNSPTVVIEPAFNSATTALPVVIGGYTGDPSGTYSFINRGTITNTPLNPNLVSTAMLVSGASPTDTTTLTDGILNTGTISAGSTTNANATQATAVTGISIGQYANIVTGITNDLVSGANSGGSISAIVSGIKPGIASAIIIAPNATVPVINNAGTIVASATTTDPTNSSETAFGIIDQSGTLLTVNNNGTITARAAAVVNGTFAPLDNNANLAQSINLAAATSGVTVNNTGSGTITGDIVLGSGNDTINTVGSAGSAITSTITANINFGRGDNALHIGENSQVVGDILQTKGASINITIANGGRLNATNNGETSSLRPIPTGTAQNIVVSNLLLETGGELDLTVSNAYNINNAINAGPIIQATSTGSITIQDQSTLAVNFGGFVSVSNVGQSAAQFIVFDTTTGNLHIADPSQVQTALTTGIPFLFNGTVCAYGITGFTSDATCSATSALGAGHDDIVLNLTPKTANDLGLTGYAAKMFAPANAALAGDNTLGAAVIQAGVPSGTKSLNAVSGQKLYQQIYSAFAPDVTGSARAVAISLTDQASNIVGERQRKLRMYAGQDGDATLWAQEFGQRLNVPNKTTAAGYSNSGFGFALGMDGGDPTSGRYGGALTFYAGSTHEKEPRDSSTNSQWYMLTGYSDWRGRHLFFDSQIDIGYGNLNGKRKLTIDDVDGNLLISRTAQAKRSSEMAAGGFTTGVIMNSGGTVFTPQLSVDALTLREEGYTESGGGAGMDLNVQPYYANSVRAFLGADLRQDLKMSSFFLQPELRAGYRYDFLDGAAKLKVKFAGDQTTSPTVDPGQPFSITGPDPAKGNLVVGGGLAVTTDAWSVGVNYDYLRGVGGTGGTSQDAMLTLIGRI
ncbi:MAG TPA: autotransporter domain-containing protein [Rhizomicrobium sp.]|jgi:hypothetical protein